MYYRNCLFALLSMISLVGAVSCSQPEVAVKTGVPLTFTWQKLETKTDASFRGLCVVSDQVFWISGSKGTVIRSIDGGKTFEDVSVPNASERDFRDVHAFDANTAIVMNAGSPGVFYRTSDGGKNWSMVYSDQRDAIFFDAMDFWDDQQGVAFGDPIDGRLVILLTEDGGQSWKELDRQFQPNMFEGEAGFAASGSCIAAVGKQTILIGTGGDIEGQSHPSSRMLVSLDRGKTWKIRQVPVRRNQSSGIFSLCKTKDDQIMVVGGDYTQPDSTAETGAISFNGGKSWTHFKNHPPSGFRSAVDSAIILDRLIFVTAGTNGIDLSVDQGLSWNRISSISVNAIAFTSVRKAIVTAGPHGSVYLGVTEF